MGPTPFFYLILVATKPLDTLFSQICLTLMVLGSMIGAQQRTPYSLCFP